MFFECIYSFKYNFVINLMEGECNLGLVYGHKVSSMCSLVCLVVTFFEFVCMYEFL